MRGELDIGGLEALLQDGRVGLVSIVHMSNVLGTVNPAARIAALAHQYGAKVMFDGSQSVVHRAVDVQAIDADFFVWTGHKLYGPTGIGILYAKRELLEAMPPFMGGGDMIGSVSMERSTWAEVPHKFEAGTPMIVEAIGLKAAIEWVEAIGMDAIAAHEARLTDHAMARLSEIPGLRVLGAAQERGGVFSFTMEGAHAHDIATLLDRQGIAVRAGNHCAEPLMHRLGVDSTARASCGIYTHRGRDRRARRHAAAGAGVLCLMFEDVRDLYSEAILDHGRRPRHAARPERFDGSARGDNPMCGDRVTVFIRRDGDTLGDAGFEARGCELTKASADLMCETVSGRGTAEIRRMAARCRDDGAHRNLPGVPDGVEAALGGARISQPVALRHSTLGGAGCGNRRGARGDGMNDVTSWTPEGEVAGKPTEDAVNRRDLHGVRPGNSR